MSGTAPEVHYKAGEGPPRSAAGGGAQVIDKPEDLGFDLPEAGSTSKVGIVVVLAVLVAGGLAFRFLGAHDEPDANRLDAREQRLRRSENVRRAPRSGSRSPRVERAVAVGVDAVLELRIDDIRRKRCRRIAVADVGAAQVACRNVVARDRRCARPAEVDQHCARREVDGDG